MPLPPSFALEEFDPRQQHRVFLLVLEKQAQENIKYGQSRGHTFEWPRLHIHLILPLSSEYGLWHFARLQVRQR
jgi:hypothetical protein